MVKALKNATFKFKPSIIFLSETKQKNRYLKKIKMKMKMMESFYVDQSGIAGSLVLWLSTDAKISIINMGSILLI
ncbi:hypothetical protein GQ457_09G015690 [Hibiscus cannabinus]